jgi:hypothetical protein
MSLFLLSLLACGPSKAPADTGAPPADTGSAGVGDDGAGDDGAGDDGGADTSPSSDTDDDAPSEYEYEGEQGSEPVYDPEFVEQALADFYAAAMSLNPHPAVQGYEAVMQDADPSCPSWYEVDGNSFWYASCTARSGATYDGYGFYYLYQDVDLFGDGSVWDYISLSGAATMSDAAGSTFHLGGAAAYGEGVSADGSADLWVSQIVGSISWDGPSAEGTWMEQGVQPSLLLYGVSYDAGFGNTVGYKYIDGTAAWVSDDASAIDASAMYIADEGIGWPCAAEPSGTFSVRDPDGVWWDVIFDVDVETFALDGECDGCGAVFKGTELVGEVCGDASVLMENGGKPW